jgi:DNA helicase II / ATP-dependent DNA helicase PcrA
MDPAIGHTAALDMKGPILAAEIVAFLLSKGAIVAHLTTSWNSCAAIFTGGAARRPPRATWIKPRVFEQHWQNGMKVWRQESRRQATRAEGDCCRLQRGDGADSDGHPDKDWIAVRAVLEGGGCLRLTDVASEVRNVRLLERGTQLRQELAQDWRDFGGYRTLWRSLGRRLCRSTSRAHTSPKPEWS